MIFKGQNYIFRLSSESEYCKYIEHSHAKLVFYSSEFSDFSLNIAFRVKLRVSEMIFKGQEYIFRW